MQKTPARSSMLSESLSKLLQSGKLFRASVPVPGGGALLFGTKIMMIKQSLRSEFDINSEFRKYVQVCSTPINIVYDAEKLRASVGGALGTRAQRIVCTFYR